jgi:hypothetical protein
MNPETPIAFDARLLAVLVCPLTGAPLEQRAAELWSRAAGLAYPIRNGMAALLEEEARPLTAEERSEKPA